MSTRGARITVVVAALTVGNVASSLGVPAVSDAATRRAHAATMPLSATPPLPETVVTGSAARADLGSIGIGEPARHVFRVSNEREAPLQLRIARVPTGVTVAALDATIAPHVSGRVELALDTFALVGLSQLEVMLTSDDPTRPEITLAVVADVHPFVLADPGFARYLFVQGAHEGTIAQTLASTDGADFRIVRATTPFPHLRVTVREARPDERIPGKPGRQWRLQSTLASRAPVGPLAGFIEVALDHPKQHRLRISVSGFVRPMFAVTPPRGDLGDVQAGSPVHGRFVVKNFAEERVTLERATTNLAGVGIAIGTVDPGHVYTLAVSVAGDAPIGAFDGMLRIQTSSIKEPVIQVPIRGRVIAPTSAAADPPSALPVSGGSPR